MKSVFIFPGQGSQTTGMLDEFINSYPEVRDIFDQASDILGKDLYQLTTEGHQEELNTTVNTQPIMLASCYAIWSIWEKHNAQQGGDMPILMAGHSFGEYTALVCAQAICFEDGIRIAAKRGELMQEANSDIEAAMAAVMGIGKEELQTYCQTAEQNNEQIVEMVNFNTPEQIVIAGHRQAVENVISDIQSSGSGRAVILPVSVAAHSSLMESVANELSLFLDMIDIQLPKVPVIQNVEAVSYTSVIEIKDALCRQLYNPVRWYQTVMRMGQERPDCFVEIGPGQVLSGILKRIDRKWIYHTTSTPDKLAKTIKAIS